MDTNKRQQIIQVSTYIDQHLPSSTVRKQITKNYLHLFPNEILFCIFDYLLPIDIVRAFQYDLQRYGVLIQQHIAVYGFNLINIKSNDFHLLPMCLSLIEKQHLSICVNDNYLSTALNSLSSLNTLTVILNTSFEQSFLSKIQHESISCKKLILEYTPSYHRQMNDIDIIPLLSASVNTLILRNVVFLFDQSTISHSCNYLRHIRCILKNENDLHELLIRFPMLISIDIRLVCYKVLEILTILPLPKHFRIEYPSRTVLNLSKFPQETRYYDQTVYSLPWLETNSSLVLRSCNLENYLNIFPQSLSYIRQLTIECTSEPWSSEFVNFLHRTFPNTRTLLYNLIGMNIKLEELPNEILINILEYIGSPVDIYNSFNKLNRRFNIILRSIRLSLDIFLEDKQSLTIIRYFSVYCNRLRVYNVCPLISLERFSQLRSLILIEPTDAQINSIQSTTLPMLEYLASPASMMILDCLFGINQQQWSFLRSCNFYFFYFPKAKLSWQPNRVLCTLKGITCSRMTLSQLLSLLPCLKHLRVDMIFNDSSNWNMEIFKKTLLSLRIGFNQLNYDDLCVLIAPHLYRLHIEMYHEELSLNFAHLGTLIVSLTTRLKQFNCDYRGMEIPIDEIKAAHTLFRNIQSIKSHSYDTISLICRDVI
ncbi:unnamed protein product [Rotaria sp. Silwood2]|nr:unnamed protein product [Rotaria sp. Silwood2]